MVSDAMGPRPLHQSAQSLEQLEVGQCDLLGAIALRRLQAESDVVLVEPLEPVV